MDPPSLEDVHTFAGSAVFPEPWHDVHKFAACDNVQGLAYYAKTIDLSTIKTDDDENAMHIAAQYGQMATVVFLLTHFPQMLQQTTTVADTVLHCAVKGGNVSLLEILLAQCGDDILNTTNWAGLIPLSFAVFNGCVDMAIKIINHRPEMVHVRHTASQRSLLHMAVRGGKYDMVQYILIFVPTLTKAVTVQGRNALHFAQDRSIIELLIRADSEMVHIRDQSGLSPFLWAVLNQDLAVVYLLLDLCPDVIHHDDGNGYTALYLTLSSDVARELLQRKPALIDGITPNNGDTPLHHVVFDAKPDLIKLLLNHKPELLQQRNHKHKTPLQCTDRIENINTMLRFQPDLIDIDIGGNSALHHAVRAGDNEVIALVFANQMQSLYVANHHNETPMYIAVNTRHKFAVQLFYRHITIETALELRQTCIEHCDIDIYEIIKQQLADVSQYILIDLLHIVFDFLSKRNITT